MPSFYIDRRAQADGTHVVHERAKCPPDCFPGSRDAEYLGELLNGFQAIALARLNYARVNGCLWCATEVHELGAEAAWPLPGAAAARATAAPRLAPTAAA